MSDGSAKEGQAKGGDPLDAVWETLVRPIVNRNLYEQDRIAAAISALIGIPQHEFSETRPYDNMRKIAGWLAIWHLVASEIQPDLIKYYERGYDGRATLKSLGRRNALRMVFELSDLALGPLQKEALGTRVLVLPSALFTALKDAFVALEHGEVRPLLRPKTTGKHRYPYSYQQARLQACQYIYFAVGQGSKKKVAIELVEKAIGVKFDTLRAWERALRRDPSFRVQLDYADEAGRISKGRGTATPDQTGPHRTAAYAAQVHRKLAAEPLGRFKVRFRKHFAVGAPRPPS